MAKRIIPEGVATVGIGDLQMVTVDDDVERVWQWTLENDLVIVTGRDSEAVLLEAGSVLFVPMGQMATWLSKRAAHRYTEQLALLDQMDDLHYEPNGAEHVDAPPF